MYLDGVLRTFDFLPYRQKAYREFKPIDDLTAAANVASVKTTLVISRVKFEPGVPITLGQRQPANRGGARTGRDGGRGAGGTA
jgi:hypothetical protein